MGIKMKTLLACLGVLAMSCFAGDRSNGWHFEQPEAKRAHAKYERTVNQARVEFDRDVETARREFLASLRSALEDATKKGNLDEAVHIREAKESLESQLGENKTKDETLIRIISAVYGVNQSWADVTEKLQQAVDGKSSWSTRIKDEDWADPAPGFGKTLIVRYAVADKVRLKAEYVGREFVLP